MTDPPIQPSDIGTAPNWLLGVLIAAIVALSGAVTFLFGLFAKRTATHEKRTREREQAHADQNREREQAHAQERQAWAEKEAAWDAEREAERETERANYEQRHREVVERYEILAREDREAHYTREELARREHADLLEKIQFAEKRRSESELALLEKMHNRLGGRKRGG